MSRADYERGFAKRAEELGADPSALARFACRMATLKQAEARAKCIRKTAQIHRGVDYSGEAAAPQAVAPQAVAPQKYTMDWFRNRVAKTGKGRILSDGTYVDSKGVRYDKASLQKMLDARRGGNIEAARQMNQQIAQRQMGIQYGVNPNKNIGIGAINDPRAKALQAWNKRLTDQQATNVILGNGQNYARNAVDVGAMKPVGTVNGAQVVRSGGNFYYKNNTPNGAVANYSDLTPVGQAESRNFRLKGDVGSGRSGAMNATRRRSGAYVVNGPMTRAQRMQLEAQMRRDRMGG